MENKDADPGKEKNPGAGKYLKNPLALLEKMDYHKVITRFEKESSSAVNWKSAPPGIERVQSNGNSRNERDVQDEIEILFRYSNWKVTLILLIGFL